MRTRKRCAVCPQTFVPHDARRRYCSRPCAASVRGKAFYQAMGRKGGQARAARLRPGLVERYKQLAAGLEPWQAFQTGARWQCKRTNSTAYARGVRTGYAKGWEACVKAMGRRVA